MATPDKKEINGGVEVHEISRTQEIEWPYDERHHRRVWDEVITVEPTSLTDVVVLSLWHRRRKGGIAERRPALVGETRVPVLEVHRSANMRREKPAGAEGSGGSEGGGGAGPAAVTNNPMLATAGASALIAKRALLN